MPSPSENTSFPRQSTKGTSGHQTALLNPPTMITRANGGTPYSMDGSRNRNNGFLQMNKMNQLGLQAFAATGGQFPPQRIAASMPPQVPPLGNNAFNAAGGLQGPFGMFCDVTSMAGGDKKRAASAAGVASAAGAAVKSPPLFKKAKTEPTTTAAAHFPKDNPLLVERVTALGGGFPMPKWAGIGKKVKAKEDVNERQQAQAASIPPPTRIGAFPMPPLTDCKDLSVNAPTLSSYKNLWQGTDLDVRKEILARRLHRGDVKIVNGTTYYRDGPC